LIAILDFVILRTNSEMPYNPDNEYYMTFKTEINVEGHLIAFNQDILNSLKHACEFERFLNNYDLTEHIKLYGETEVVDTEGPENVFEDLFGYNMPDGWKHKMVDEFINDMSIQDIKTFINDIGFIKCVELVNNCEFYEEEEGSLKALLTNDGLRRFFYCVMYEMIEIADGVEETNIPTWQVHFGDYWDPNHINDSDDDNDDDSDDDEEQIVPITDEALDRIGGAVAMCA